MGGYSKRSLLDKLGIKAGHKLHFLNPPENYYQTLGPLPENATVVADLHSTIDFTQFFTTRQAELKQRFPELKRALAQNGMLWISWPKGSAKVPTDLNENIVREIGVKNGLVDIKVCAVDEVWSGLKFVYRVKDR